MDSHGWLFWVLIPLFFFTFFRGRRRWGEYRDFHQHAKRNLKKQIRAGARGEGRDLDLDYKQDEELAEHRHYIDELEKRVAELENRLDFTERLLAGRREPVAEETAGPR